MGTFQKQTGKAISSQKFNSNNTKNKENASKIFLLFLSSCQPKPSHYFISNCWADPRLSLIYHLNSGLFIMCSISEQAMPGLVKPISPSPQCAHSVGGMVVAPLFSHCGMFRSQLRWRAIRPLSVPASDRHWVLGWVGGCNTAKVNTRRASRRGSPPSTPTHSTHSPQPSRVPQQQNRVDIDKHTHTETQTDTHRSWRGCVGAQVWCPW